MENDWRELVRKNDLLAIAQAQTTKQMSKEEIERRISVFIKSHNMCVLCTARDNIPRATPIEYWADGTTIYIFADPGTKRDNIKANPKVSIGIHDPFTGGSLSVKGMQITGEATLLTDDNPEYNEALIMRMRELVGEDLGDYKPRQGGAVIKVVAKKIEFIDIALKIEGYDLRYVWEA
jgi:nitroimidazol reductase NimA-like FMN-containing flavoprotein (pyridoxamine 5'-phosphate oxidase superfamily)